MAVFLLLLDRVIAVVVRTDDAGQVVHPVRGSSPGWTISLQEEGTNSSGEDIWRVCLSSPSKIEVRMKMSRKMMMISAAC